MVDSVNKEKRSWIMSHIRSKNTKIELLVRSVLWAKGFRYRKHFGEYKIDIAFPRLRVAIFIDSCFWHGCHKHYRVPKSNVKFWEDKIIRNQKRDAFVSKKLKSQGWIVIRIWEHRIKNDFDGVIDEISKSLAPQDLHRQKVN